MSVLVGGSWPKASVAEHKPGIQLPQTFCPGVQVCLPPAVDIPSVHVLSQSMEQSL